LAEFLAVTPVKDGTMATCTRNTTDSLLLIIDFKMGFRETKVATNIKAIIGMARTACKVVVTAEIVVVRTVATTKAEATVEVQVAAVTATGAEEEDSTIEINQCMLLGELDSTLDLTTIVIVATLVGANIITKLVET